MPIGAGPQAEQGGNQQKQLAGAPGGQPQAGGQAGGPQSQAGPGGAAMGGGGGGGGGIGSIITMKAMAEVNGVDYYGRLLAGMDELDLQAEAILYA